MTPPIDVTYRFFATPRRKFIVVDTPGHEQYAHNMVTGASTADVAVLLIDARQGVLTQTRRHAYLVSLVGIKQVILAVNKMDMVGYQQAVFEVSWPISARWHNRSVSRASRQFRCRHSRGTTSPSAAAYALVPRAYPDGLPEDTSHHQTRSQ